jgi:eukaryotic-like serine/threonine-protein kinase
LPQGSVPSTLSAMSESTEAAPRIVGRYEIFDEIASGGMATVFLGRLLGSGGFSRTVAIKRLHPQFAKDPEFVTMFLDEARLAARIRHPNVVPTLDVVASRGELFLVLEYVQGESLSRLVRCLKARGERIPLTISVRVMADVLQGLHAAHEARDERGVPLNIVHRDVTPQNILVGSDGVSRLLDFGVAKAAGRSRTTQEGQIKGKLAYMAPEQLMSTGVTRQTDLYAAAVVFWEILTGERLIDGDTDVDVVARLLKRDIQSPRRIVPDIPPQLDDLVMRGLSAKVEDRFATAREMCVALGQCRVAEAPSIAVGEWVENLAAAALADRMAKVTAIESHRDSAFITHDAANAPKPPAPDAASVRKAAADAPTVVAAGTNRTKRASSDPPADSLSVSLSTSAIRRSARARVLGAVVILTAGLMLCVVALVRAVQHRSPAPALSQATARPAASVAASRALEATASVPLPEPTAKAEEAIAPAPTAVDTPSRESTPARSDVPPSRRPAGAVVVRPRAAGTAPRPVDNPDRVFESRQ